MNAIERFIFIEFRLQSTRSSYGSSEFNRAAHNLHEGTKSVDDIIEMINAKMEHSFERDHDGQKYFKAQNMQYLVNKLFESKDKDERAGYYRWSAIHYFLYEYEKKLLKEHHHGRNVSWDDFKQSENDKISIEHIFPHKANEITYWNEMFKDIPNKDWSVYEGSLGNMLLLSQQINASLQNKDYKSKKEGDEDRQGYENGSCSENFICKNYSEWTPEAIKTQGLKMLEFMEIHWGFKFKSEEEKMELLLPGLQEIMNEKMKEK